MKYVLRLLLLVLLSCASAEMQGATATINKVWLEHGTKLNNRYVLKVNVDFSVKGGKGDKFTWCVWLKGPDNEWHRMNNAHYNRDGVAYMQSSYFTPPYDDTRYSNAWMSIYIDDLNMLPGKNKYKVIVTVNQDGKTLAQSDPESFDGTGSSKSNSAVNNSYNNYNNGSGNKANNNSGDVQTWREELGYGGFVIVKKFPNGYIMRTRYRLCPNCNGTQMCGNCRGSGMCPICNGQGGIISAGYGNYYPCYSCQSTGRCMLCHGNRVCSACNGSQYAGYVIGSTATIAPDGTTTRDNVDYNGYDSGRHDHGGNSSNSSKGCSKCGGTGVNKSPNSGGSLSSWVAYYNSSGTECPYCGSYTSHYHDRCAGCNVPR